jgi:hypothetical protein
MPPLASDDSKAIAAREYVVRTDLLQNWLDRRLSSDARAWLGEQLQQIRGNAGSPAFLAAFDLVPRRLGLDERRNFFEVALVKRQAGGADE